MDSTPSAENPQPPKGHKAQPTSVKGPSLVDAHKSRHGGTHSVSPRQHGPISKASNSNGPSQPTRGSPSTSALGISAWIEPVTLFYKLTPRVHRWFDVPGRQGAQTQGTRLRGQPRWLVRRRFGADHVGSGSCSGSGLGDVGP
ncbi:hypothetical protein F66182_160 [Fusarium sp. NRRL 66182]|nr:hypothetical protein F66182_160 [Fusarium sp. NRRL 66182]